jgi:signal transduction histidine kinase
MNRSEFEGRWLVVGTESKVSGQGTPSIDRNGLYVRPRQGQKGIGRLSCANLGPALLLISKRRTAPFVTALLDWRLFENPFVNLSDIHVPVAEFDTKDELFGLLPELAKGLAENVVGGEDEARTSRLRTAWQSYDQLVRDEQEVDESGKTEPPSEEILATVSGNPFGERHLAQWPVWSGESEHGTALLVGKINYDLQVELDQTIADSSATGARARFFETLSSFVDPFFDPADLGTVSRDIQFTYAVRAWHGDTQNLIVGSDKQFDRRLLDGMEHQLEGLVDANGVFAGRVKAFGKWVIEPCVIEPPKDLIIPRRADTVVGKFDLYIASMEFQAANTTLPREQFLRFRELAERYSGFMIFRDGLRVLPYGRTDNDFFEIESRRSMSAGREFWNHRQMFGRLAITRHGNPNLKDKAGREGILDNRAAKALKILVSNILRQTARRYFGSDSHFREELLPQIKSSNKAEKARLERNKLRQRQRREFRDKLQSYSKSLPLFTSELETFAINLTLKGERDISPAQQKLEEFRERLADFRLPGAPKELGPLEGAFADYRDQIRTANVLLATSAKDLDEQIEGISPSKPRELLEHQIARNAGQIHHRIQMWKRAIDVLQRAEFERVRTLVGDRNKLFHLEATPLLARFDRAELTYNDASKLLERLKEDMDAANEDTFVPYIGALESLKESIDLENLATIGMEELSDLRAELDRLNSLAQLGIAVEIVGHELQAYDDIIGSGLRRLPDDVREGKAAKDIEFGYDGLTDQLRFLSPLRLAGQRVQRWITGAEIADYLGEFFKLNLAKNAITLDARSAFRALRVYDQQSRLFPVFINLINNSIYWVGTSSPDQRRIVIDLVGDDVVISDSGPGVDPEDVDNLFNLFFTKKARGGRGVGLYLSRANLAAGGHKIRYEPSGAGMPLNGANFLISFKGAELDGR